MISRIKSWGRNFKQAWARRREARAARAYHRRIELGANTFNELIRDKKSGMAEYVNQIAWKQAEAYVMNWMDAKRIHHCHYCSVTGPLKNHLDFQVCEKHEEIVKMQPTTNGKVEIVK